MHGGLDGKRLSRREFVGIGGMGTAALLLGAGGERALADPVFSEDPFKLGVASGDPLPDGVVLWTRLAPDPLSEDGFGGMPSRRVAVRWEVAEDEGFRRIVRRGTEVAGPDLAHSVHAEVGGLRPGWEYFYRFKAGSEVSPVGKTKTAPALGTPLDRLAFALASCQSWAGGRYAAYRNMAQEDLDLVVHVGDYIYEGRDTETLADFRGIHALYKTSPDLQAAHAAFPFVVTFDDHEIENNWADEISQDDNEASNEKARFLALRANAFQAYYEHLPLRRGSKPNGPDMLLYRRLAYGNLAEFNVLDTRQYRSDQPVNAFIAPRDPDSLDPSQTMTGAEQERWLFDGLDRSQARWNILAQQSIMAQYDYDTGDGESINHDQWDGYVAARERLLGFVEERRPSNPVVISGDWHSSWVNDLKTSYRDPASETVATEFVGTSISSGCGWRDDVEAALSENPHVKFFDGVRRGYVRCTLTPESFVADFRVVSSASDPDLPASTLASFEVTDGRPGAIRRGGIEVTGAEAPTMFLGRSNPVRISVRNGTEETVEVTARAKVPQGWQGGNAVARLAPGEEAVLESSVTPPPGPKPLAATIEAEATAPGTETYGPSSRMFVVAAPPAEEAFLALDAGGPAGPLLSGYRQLSPQDAWDPAKGYGWVGAAPIFRDRGASTGVLQRDFALSRGAPTTLRVFVPQGRHTLYALTGDASFESGNTIVSNNGSMVGQSGDEIIPAGRFEWFGFELDGGPEGRTFDLEITGALREGYWRIGALVMTP